MSYRRSAVRSLGAAIILLLSSILPARSHAEPPVDPVEVPITFTKVGQSPERVKIAQPHNLTKSRFGHTATLLPNGEVLIVGGTHYDINGYSVRLATAERYNPTIGSVLSAGSMAITRTFAAATLLPSGQVLVTGGGSTQAELYIPATNRWQSAGTMSESRYGHTATLLANGKVLITGGTPDERSDLILASTELYDPATNTFSAHTSMTQTRTRHQAVQLLNGNVLVVGGSNGLTGDLYVPETGTWQSLAFSELTLMALVQPNGQVLLAGRYLHHYDPNIGTITRLSEIDLQNVSQILPLAGDKVLLVGNALGWGVAEAQYQIYDPATNTLAGWFVPRYQLGTDWVPLAAYGLTIPLPDGRFVTSGGHYSRLRQNISSSKLVVGSLRPRTSFGISLTFPGIMADNQPWVIRPELPVQVEVHAVPPPAGPLFIKFQEDRAFQALNSGQPFSTTLGLSNNAGYDPAYLIRALLHEPDGVQTALDIEQVGFISMQPVINPLIIAPALHSPVRLQWNGWPWGGLIGYDLHVRHRDDLDWTVVISNSPSTTTLWHAPQTGTYQFRVRSRDRVGRTSEWSPINETTITHITALALPVVINNGALATTDPLVTFGFAGQMLLPSVAEMRLNMDGIQWEPWQPYESTLKRLITQPGPNMILVQFRDQAGTVSPFVAPTIRLDQAAGSEVLASINNGAVFTNDRTVRVMTGGPAGATQIQISNDGGFAGATWQPFDTQTPWQITTYGNFAIPRSVYVRVRTADGTIIGPTSDDIIYDPIPPTGTISITAQTANSLRVVLAASDPDNISGLAGMRVGTPEQFATAAWEPFAAEKTLAMSSADPLQPVYAQFRDAANNTTPILCVTPAGSACGPTPRINLPFIAQ